jgi:hypothetical protein
LDAELELAFQPNFGPAEGYYRQPILLPAEHQRPGILEYVQISGVSARPASPYTFSIDAAIKLIERKLPGRDIILETRESMADGAVRRTSDATIGEAYYSPEKPTHAYGNTPALSLIASLLRAIAQGET